MVASCVGFFILFAGKEARRGSPASADPKAAARKISQPLVGVDGKTIGRIELEVADPVRSGFPSTHRKIYFYAFAGFLLSFLASLKIPSRTETFFPGIIAFLKKVGAGNLDAEIPTPATEEQRELAQALDHMLEGLRERDRMRHSLGRIMDPKIAEVLIKEDPKVGGLRRQATILFCDIRNYTSLCEELSVDELQVFLNEYWKETVEIIMEQEGTIDKFHGDGVCVVFGAPILHADDTLRAVRTAWRLVKNVADFNRRRESQRKNPVHIGIGIHRGEVIAGHIGSERRMDYTVVGDVVNVAARIEELNKKFGTQIIISDDVYEDVEAYARVKTLTLAHLRGHKKPFLVHAVVDFSENEGQTSEQKAA